MSSSEKKRLAIVGCGKLGNIVTEACCMGLLPEYELVGVLGRNRDHAQALAEKGNCKVCEKLEELMELKPDYVAEMASVQMVKDMAETVLAGGANLVVLSIGAFADQEFYQKVQKTAREHKRRVHIASGAIGGFDVLRTVALMGHLNQEKAASKGEESKQITNMVTRKGPASLKNTPVFREELMESKEDTEVFAGNTKEAIALLPTKVNVSVAASIASAGTEKMDFHIISVPGMIGDDHKITEEIDGVTAVVDVYSRTSDIAGWSVVALLQNLVSPIMF